MKTASDEEDRSWLLQGWKGRVIRAISKWKPNQSYADREASPWSSRD
jgi:hypothetical protein